MIVGIGIDLVEIARIEKLLAEPGERARARVVTPLELERAARGREAETLAARFAAKEAAMKALRTGWSGGIGFRDIEIGRDEAGAPTLAFHGAALRRAEELKVARGHVSLTHTRDFAQAIVVLES
jgi:holo-[acyl-carrier protein] synthase